MLYLLVFKPDLKAEINSMDALFREEKKRIIAENKEAQAEIKRSAKEIDAQAKRAQKSENEYELMRSELMQQGLREDEAKEVAGMTLQQLFDLKIKEMNDVSADFIINAITRRVLIDSEFEHRADVKDFKVPVNLTTKFTAKDVEKYLMSLDEVTLGQTKKKPAAAKKKTASAKASSDTVNIKVDRQEEKKPASETYKVGGKSFALLAAKDGGKFKLTVKCGPYYGQRLSQLYPDFFGKAKFPYGMIWFAVEKSDEDCSFELVKLLISISYYIAKAGY